MSDEVASVTEPTIDSTSVHEAPVQVFAAQRAAARTSAARQAFSAALAAGTAGSEAESDDDDIAPSPSAPTRPEPVKAAEPAAMPQPDAEVQRLRERLAAERDAFAANQTGEAKPARRGLEELADDYVDRPAAAYRQWLESMRGDSLSDDDFRAEVRDFVTSLSTDVLGVPLPATVRAQFDAAQARKSLKAMKTAESRREATARERAEAEQAEQEWARAASALDQRVAAEAKTYPWLAAEDSPGGVLVEVIRAANGQGSRLTWQDAAKLADHHLKSEAQRRESKRKAVTAPAAPAPVVAKTTPAETIAPKKWSRKAHLAQTKAAFSALARKNAAE